MCRHPTTGMIFAFVNSYGMEAYKPPLSLRRATIVEFESHACHLRCARPGLRLLDARLCQKYTGGRDPNISACVATRLGCREEVM